MANKQSGGTRLTGINPLSYMGVEPVSPPQLVRYQVAPTNRDFNFNLGDLWLVESPFEVWMLLEKPQNVAFWALIYPQGGAGGGISLIHTGGPDVIGDVNDAISILGGENINTTASDPNTLIINLNRTIQWPDTNSFGTEGVIYLGGDRFLHNFGDVGGGAFNTFLGINSGNFSLTNNSLSNTGIGALALTELTAGLRNTGIGAEALSGVTIGENNIGLGRAAGDNVVAGNDNIHIGNRGASADADNGTIRIGTESVQIEAYIAGIYNSVIDDTTSHVVFIDSDGKLGAGEASFGASFSQPFLGIQQIYTGDLWPGGNVNIANYALGSAAPLDGLGSYDVGNNFFAGDGAGTGVITNPATFTAPATGKYHFRITVAFGDSGGNNSATPSGRKWSGIAVNGVLAYWTAHAFSSTVEFSFDKEWDIALTSGDVVTFVINASGALAASGIAATYTSGDIFGPVINPTTISGYRIG